MDAQDECIMKCPDLQKYEGMPISPKLAHILMQSNRIRQHTKLWYTTRTRMITCSDIPAVNGENPYTSRKQVFRKKTGQSRPFKGNKATRRGTAMEPIAIKAYELKSGKRIWPEDIGLCLHPTWDVIGGSPDGITLDGILLEVKCPLTREIISGHMPNLYNGQVQVLLEIFDLEEAHFVQYRPGNVYTDEVCDITVVRRDRVYFAKLLPILLDFMEEVTLFYNSANLPIGTPMIDWEQEDKQAKLKHDTDVDNGIGTICTFITCPRSKRRKFVIEKYEGPGKPMLRSEFKLDENVVFDGDSDIQEANTIKSEWMSCEKQDTSGIIELDMNRIISNLPQHLRPDPDLHTTDNSYDEEYL
jgi:putative phage-type endonuclease